MADYLVWIDSSVLWDVTLMRLLHDWEVEAMIMFWEELILFLGRIFGR